MARRRTIVRGVQVIFTRELPEGIEATGRLGTRERPGARVYVRPSLAASSRLESIVCGVINSLYRAALA